MKIVIIDNYDSFTYNLAHLVKELGADVTVYRNDQFLLRELDRFDKIILSPGPGIPSEAGLLMDVIKIVVDSRMMIVHSRSYNLKNGNAVCEITVRLNGNDQLQQLMDKLKRIPGVISVERTKKG